MSKLHVAIAALLLAPLAACSAGNQGGSYSSAFQHLSIDGSGNVIAHARDGRQATVTAAGDLSLGGKAVTVTPAQRQLLGAYHGAALKLRDDGVATGKAGMQTGMAALSAVASGLASGKPDSIGAKVDASAGKVDALARNVCHDLGALYQDQTAVAEAIPAFTPYATIQAHAVSDCHVEPPASGSQP
jgi:hypothetical protein